MKLMIVLSLLILGSCVSNSEKENDRSHTEAPTLDSVQENADTIFGNHKVSPVAEEPTNFSNDRFKNVTVTKKAENEFLVEGKARVFEATFNWIIEDDHQEIESGYNTTDAGAPDWGNFKFTIRAKRPNANSALHLILFEASAKDGSRQSELPILLKN